LKAETAPRNILTALKTIAVIKSAGKLEIFLDSASKDRNNVRSRRIYPRIPQIDTGMPINIE
jgi:hypothetical protein